MYKLYKLISDIVFFLFKKSPTVGKRPASEVYRSNPSASFIGAMCSLSAPWTLCLCLERSSAHVSPLLCVDRFGRVWNHGSVDGRRRRLSLMESGTSNHNLMQTRQLSEKPCI